MLRLPTALPITLALASTLLATGSATGEQQPGLRIALLPNEPLVEASERVASWLDKKLERALARRAKLLPRAAVVEAMSAAGVDRGSACDDGCLVELGKKLGADRVVRQSISLQDKVQSKGTVWIWTVHQVDVASGRAHGHFERMCMCAKSVWDFIARQHAERLVEFDPAARVELGDAQPAAPAGGPTDEPGMVFVPAGKFVMGSELGEFDEEPRHVVDLDPFYIDKYEVTNEQYGRCVDAGECQRQSVAHIEELMGAKQPVVGVGWFDGVAYCRFAGKRLPTEAEWEKAARGTDERRYPWGDEWLPDQVNLHHAEDGYAWTSPVGSFPKNVSPYGAYDMAGNAWEWTQDYWDRHYYRDSPEENPTGPRTGTTRVMRGGSWMYDVPFFARAHNRSPGKPLVRKRYVGFRCAKDAP